MAETWVRVSIVNYNAGSILQRCINALAAQTMENFEAVVVDNGSSDTSISQLKLPDQRFAIKALNANLGFAAANNIAFENCTSPWVATLNPDAFPAPTWLEELQVAVNRHPWAHAFGSTQLQLGSRNLVDGFGDNFCIWGFAWRGLGGQSVSHLPDADCEVFAPCAAAALYSRTAFEALKGFDERFFCYLEDVDLGFRFRLNGFRCAQVRRAEILHMGSAISGKTSDFTIFHSYRNRVWLLTKNLPGTLLALMLPLHIFLVLLQLSRPSGFNRRAAINGIWAGLRGLPQAIRSRMQIQRQRKIGIVRLAKMMVWDLRKVTNQTPHFLSAGNQDELA